MEAHIALEAAVGQGHKDAALAVVPAQLGRKLALLCLESPELGGGLSVVRAHLAQPQPHLCQLVFCEAEVKWGSGAEVMWDAAVGGGQPKPQQGPALSSRLQTRPAWQ